MPHRSFIVNFVSLLPRRVQFILPPRAPKCALTTLRCYLGAPTHSMLLPSAHNCDSHRVSTNHFL